jgi:phage terminase large subunit GpA-like protein
MPARYVFLDEVDAYEGDVDGEGDPVALAIARTRTFGHRAKVFLVSTPTIKGLSRIEREFEASDQRRFFVPCPHCSVLQWLKFERLKWTSGEPASATYHCEGCDQSVAEHHKTAMLSAGEWRTTATPADPHCVGFHISGLYSPVGWLGWADIAREWEAAQGDDAALKAAKNTLLGETWQERGEAPDWQRLYERREDFAPRVAQCGLILTAGADVQHDRIEVDIWAWGRRLTSARFSIAIRLKAEHNVNNRKKWMHRYAGFWSLSSGYSSFLRSFPARNRKPRPQHPRRHWDFYERRSLLRHGACHGRVSRLVHLGPPNGIWTVSHCRQLCVGPFCYQDFGRHLSFVARVQVA